MTPRQKGFIVLAAILTAVYIFVNNANVNSHNKRQLASAASMEIRANLMDLMAFEAEYSDPYGMADYGSMKRTINIIPVTKFFAKGEEVFDFKPAALVKFRDFKKEFAAYGYVEGAKEIKITPKQAGELIKLYEELRDFFQDADEWE